MSTDPTDPRTDEQTAREDAAYNAGYASMRYDSRVWHQALLGAIPAILAAADAVGAVPEPTPPTHCTCADLLPEGGTVQPCPLHGLFGEEVCAPGYHRWVCNRCHVGGPDERGEAEERAAKAALRAAVPTDEPTPTQAEEGTA
jgi:hypothetical protein